MYSELINYAIRSTACLAFFYVFYALILRNETCFRFNRRYLLTTLILSFILPLLNFTISVTGTTSIDPNAFILPEMIISDTALANANQRINIFGILNISYIIITLMLVIRLVYRMYHLWKIVSKNRHLRENKYLYEIVPTDGKLPTSSFLNYLFWDNTSHLSDIEKHQIIAHEKVHILEHHTYDILLVEFMSIICWFNPFIWLWKKEITQNHEYLADAQASHGADAYSELLAKHTLALNGFAIIHPFKSSEVIKRLTMLRKYGQRTRLIKLLAAIPLLIFMIFTMSFSVKEIINEPIANDNEAVVALSKTAISDEIIQYTEYKNQKETFVNIKNDYHIPKKVIPKPVGILGMKESISISLEEENEVFAIVEESAQPQDGMTEFYQYVAQSMRYPKQARKLGIEGRVFVEFVVDKHGNLTEVKAIKGIGAGCDAEAVRTISNAPPWKPGKQRGKAVKQKIVLPITFKLG